MQDELLTQYLTWKINIQTLALQVRAAKQEGVTQWIANLLNTLTEINQIASLYGPFDYQSPPVQVWPPYLAPPAKGDTLYATVIRELEALFGNVTHAATLRIEEDPK